MAGSFFFRHRDGKRCQHQRPGRQPCPGGAWAYVVDVPTADGSRRQKSKGGFFTRRDAEAAVRSLIEGVAAGTEPLARQRETVGVFMSDWLAGRTRLKPMTRYSYASQMRRHIIPSLGAIPLARLEPRHIARMTAKLLEQDMAATAHYCHAILHRALKDAVRAGKITVNPADRVEAPPRPRPEMKVWTAGQTAAFFEAIRGHRLEALYVLVASTGCRRGEAIALRWSDIDLIAGKVVFRRSLTRVGGTLVFGTPKTGEGRTVSLDAGCVAALRAHAERQAVEMAHWNELHAYADQGLVFCRENGTPLRPERVSEKFHELAQKAALPNIRLHDLRHGWATHALAAGVPVHVVARRLGHSRIDTTLGTYAHVLPHQDELAATVVAALFQPADSDSVKSRVKNEDVTPSDQHL